MQIQKATTKPSLNLSLLSSSLALLNKNNTTPSIYSPSPTASSTTLTNRTRKWNSQTSVIINHPVLSLIETCSSMTQLKQIHAHMTRTGLISHTFPLSRLLAFTALSDSGDLSYSLRVFERIETPNTFMWNTMIRGCCSCWSDEGLGRMGFGFFVRMVREGVELDSRSFVFGLKACWRFSGFGEGRSIHGFIWKMGFSCDLLVCNGLVHFYGVIDCLGSSRQVFDEMPFRDVVSWTSMIDGYVAWGLPDEALELFDSMLLSGGVMPNDVTIIAVLPGCSKKRDLKYGMWVHEYVKKRSIDGSMNVMNAILDMYIKCGSLAMAREVFDSMRNRDVFTWTIMINGYAKSCGLEIARTLFNLMPQRNVVTWNAMIAGYSQNNQPMEALELFHEMIEAGLFPMENTLVCILSACGQLGYLDFGRWVHLYYIDGKNIIMSMIISNALVDMYGKCGDIDSAKNVFNNMVEKNLVSWNSVINTYASHGHAREALDMYKEMISGGFKPDDITFVGVLSACNHGRLVTEGQEFLQNMKRVHGIEPKCEHYACMIDLFGRVGLLENAYELITKMPMEPNEASWGALLHACKMHGNVELAKVVANKLMELDPEDGGIYVLLATISADGKDWSNVMSTRNTMKEGCIKKVPGHSLIEVNGEFHQFFAREESNSQSQGIYRVLNELYLLSKSEDTLESLDSFMFISLSYK